VLLVENITGKPSICRDLAIIKISAPQNERSQILEVVTVFRARVVDFDTDSLTIEMTGSEEKIDRLLKVLRPYGILEMVRTGVVAMRRGTNAQQEAAAAVARASGNGAATVAADDNVSYSV
jgi:acetolactate synthase-1/3 small subunit